MPAQEFVCFDLGMSMPSLSNSDFPAAATEFENGYDTVIQKIFYIAGSPWQTDKTNEER